MSKKSTKKTASETTNKTTPKIANKTTPKIINKTIPESTKAPTVSLSKVQQFMLLCLPFCLFFSYHPVVPILSTATTNFELSLPLLWLLIFATLSLPQNLRLFHYSLTTIVKIKYPAKLILQSLQGNAPISQVDNLFPHVFRLFTLTYPLLTTCDAIISPNFMRALLISGVIWCIYLSLLTIIQNIVQYKTQIGKNVKKNLLIAVTLVSVFCWLQSILDVAGVSQNITLLCKGCTSTVFGFPHPNGFAIEPQFMANLLLAPIFLSLYYLLEAKPQNNKKSSIIFNHFQVPVQPFRMILPLFLIATLYLTLSRGAIFSFWVGIFVLFLYKTATLIKQKTSKREIFFRQPLSFFAIVFLPLFFTFSAQGLFTELGPTNHNFLDGISTSISQLSLGRINLAKMLHKTNEDNMVNKDQVAHAPQEIDKNKSHTPDSKNESISSPQSPIFTGYIEESTNVRLNLNRLALSSWQTSSDRMIGGVGLGAAGIKLYQEFPELGSPKEIIQNEYISILYEQGIFGALMLLYTAALIVVIYKMHNKNREKTSIYGFVLILSFALTLSFFSGLPNVLHIYLLPILFF